MNQYFEKGDVIEIFQDGEKIDEGSVLSASHNSEKQTIGFKSEFLRIDGILEFGAFSDGNSEEVGWFYLFKDPFSFVKCFSQNGPIYKFKRKK